MLMPALPLLDSLALHFCDVLVAHVVLVNHGATKLDLAPPLVVLRVRNSTRWELGSHTESEPLAASHVLSKDVVV